MVGQGLELKNKVRRPHACERECECKCACECKFESKCEGKCAFEFQCEEGWPVHLAWVFFSIGRSQESLWARRDSFKLLPLM